MYTLVESLFEDTDNDIVEESLIESTNSEAKDDFEKFLNSVDALYSACHDANNEDNELIGKVESLRATVDSVQTSLNDINVYIADKYHKINYADDVEDPEEARDTYKKSLEGHNDALKS